MKSRATTFMYMAIKIVNINPFFRQLSLFFLLLSLYGCLQGTFPACCVNYGFQSFATNEMKIIFVTFLRIKLHFICNQASETNSKLIQVHRDLEKKEKLYLVTVSVLVIINFPSKMHLQCAYFYVQVFCMPKDQKGDTL